MPAVELYEATIERLDALRIDNESYDEIVTELINIYESEGSRSPSVTIGSNKNRNTAR
ncbi:hypothetical protein HKK80_11655 [Halonotius sp. F2-221B]|uniref:DUF7557 family protein n=1 Tax=Halonotius sp. F2-221B TaxID=2731620 RepID=UPI00398A50FC